MYKRWFILFNFALAPISTLVRTALVTGFRQPLQMNDFATFNMLPFIPLHFLCTHFWHLVHCNELLPTPLLQTPHGHLAAFCHTLWRSPLIITLALFILTLMPLLSTFSFHSFNLLISSSSSPACVITYLLHDLSCTDSWLYRRVLIAIDL